MVYDEWQEGEGLKPQYVIEQLRDNTPDDTIVASGVGQHQMWASQFWKFNHPYTWINSGGLGTMGYGLPAAMGVQVAHPKELVICVAGEASYLMNVQELSTISQYRLPV